MSHDEARRLWIQQALANSQDATESAADVLSLDGTPERELQPNVGSQVVRFLECLFQGNEQEEGNITFTQAGVVTSLTAFNEFTFDRSIFTDNTYSTGNDGYAIKTGGSKLVIRDTCIYQNSFAGSGAIQHFGDGTVDSTNNFVFDNGDDLTCEFIAQSSQSHLLRFEAANDITCIDADSSTCAVNESITLPPSSATESDPPSSTPSFSPSQMPDDSGPVPTGSPGPPADGSISSDAPSTIPTIVNMGDDEPTASPSTGGPTLTFSPSTEFKPTKEPTAETDPPSDVPSSVPSVPAVANDGARATGVTSHGVVLQAHCGGAWSSCVLVLVSLVMGMFK